MIFDFTNRECRTECIDGCGSLTDWMSSGMVANQVRNNHENSINHRCVVKQRMKPDEFWVEPN